MGASNPRARDNHAVTVPELRTLVDGADQIGQAWVRLEFERRTKPAYITGPVNTGPVRLPLTVGDRRKWGPKSADGRVVERAGPGRWAAFWSVVDLRAWLDRQ